MSMAQPAPIISIVTVTFNDLENLKLACESVLRQESASFEHIIVDGGSSDGTAEWVESTYALDVDCKFSSGPDDGIFDAMNRGLRVATGELVLFMNGGDRLPRADSLAAVSESYRREQWEWSYGAITYVDDELTPIRDYSNPTFSLRRLSLGLDFVPHPTLFAKRSILLEEGGFNLRFGFSADQELAVRLASHGMPKVFREVQSLYKINGAHGASSSIGTARRYQEIRKSHQMRLGASVMLDEIFTIMLAARWEAGRLKRRLFERFNLA
ncbi:glycosyltransferase family 2 protein [Demequina sp. NBRC 110055]|uniref:glycosyltransferase family 2 protein n=1 Tax=Demequina sp. NBRC 110055 TaxID=1570344 RepID=UPI0009FF3D93|nr:glycosyltransferase family 2 protein [Demequina sp. NBRC 110055]